MTAVWRMAVCFLRNKVKCHLQQTKWQFRNTLALVNIYILAPINLDGVQTLCRVLKIEFLSSRRPVVCFKKKKNWADEVLAKQNLTTSSFFVNVFHCVSFKFEQNSVYNVTVEIKGSQCNSSHGGLHQYWVPADSLRYQRSWILASLVHDAFVFWKQTPDLGI